jgi:hypothetical protein
MMNYVYGYGFGVGLWILAACVLLLAAGRWYSEQQSSDNASVSAEEFVSRSAIFIAIGFGVLVGYLGYSDRRTANSDELVLLEKVMFKRGEVCSLSQPVIKQSLSAQGQLIELVIDKESESFGSLGSISTLLDMGVSTIRFMGRDFSYQSGSAERLLTSKSNTDSKPSLVLKVSYTEAYLKKSFRLQVTDSNKNTLLDHAWHRDNKGMACPEFSMGGAKESLNKSTKPDLLRY